LIDARFGSKNDCSCEPELPLHARIALWGGTHVQAFKEIPMRVAILGAAAVAAAFMMHSPTPVQAAWCGIYNDGAENCGFVSLQQCMAAISGDSQGVCQPDGRTYLRTERGRRAYTPAPLLWPFGW
jgi:hypothetical protein